MNKPANPSEHTQVAGASSCATTDEKDFNDYPTLGDSQNSAVSLVEIDRILRVPMPLSRTPEIAPQDTCRPQGDQPSTVWVMTDDEFTDPYGFTGPLPVTSTQRMIPTGEFKPGLSVGQPAPDFELPNHLGETVSFHADRAGSRAALLFYRSAVW